MLAGAALRLVGRAPGAPCLRAASFCAILPHLLLAQGSKWSAVGAFWAEMRQFGAEMGLDGATSLRARGLSSGSCVSVIGARIGVRGATAQRADGKGVDFCGGCPLSLAGGSKRGRCRSRSRSFPPSCSYGRRAARGFSGRTRFGLSRRERARGAGATSASRHSLEGGNPAPFGRSAQEPNSPSPYRDLCITLASPRSAVPRSQYRRFARSSTAGSAKSPPITASSAPARPQFRGFAGPQTANGRNTPLPTRSATLSQPVRPPQVVPQRLEQRLRLVPH